MSIVLSQLSATAFKLARPAAQSVPIMLSMLKKAPMSFAGYGLGPCMARVTFVEWPLGSSVNSTML
jgi:hypothetical protein